MQPKRNQIPQPQQKPNNKEPSTSQPIQKQLRILDYRNGKYQGFTSQKNLIRNGLGILIDDNYSFVISDWKNNSIKGPFFMVYPDQSILYGYLQNDKIGQIVCYQVDKQFNMIFGKNTNTIIVDLIPSSTILVFKVDKKILDQHTVESILSIKEQNQKNQKINSGISLLSQEHYGSSEQKFNIYQKKLSLSKIPQHLKNYELFIMHYFALNNQKVDLIQLVRTRQDISINFKKSALTLFIKLQVQTNHVKSLGSMNRYENQYQFYKKYINSTNSAEQTVIKNKKPATIEYNLRPNIRPSKCQQQLSKLHKSSITYVNQYLNISFLYSIKQYLIKINTLINIFATNKFAQVQLQNSRYQYKQQGIQNKQKFTPNVNYTLSQVQQEIYQAVKRKRQSTGKKSIVSKSIVSKSQNKPVDHHKSFDYIPQTTGRQNDITKSRNSPYIQALNTQDSGRLNRSKTYLSISNIQKNYEIKQTPTKDTSTPLKKSQNLISAKKYTYLEDTQNYDNKKPQIYKKGNTASKYDGFNNKYLPQDIKRLTQDYQIIKKEIQLSTPKGKSGRSPYRLDNSAYQNTSKIQNYDAYNPQTVNKYTPLSQKKVFKYLPS